MNKRRAFTLIELTVTMSAGSVMMILAIGMLHQSMSLATIARQRADHQRSLDRLAGEFRRDVHQALQFNVETQDRIELIMPDEKVVTYVAQGNLVTRQQPLDEGRSRREAFEFNDSSTATFESLKQPARAVLTVVHQSPGGGLAKPRIDRKVAAVLGRLTMHEQAEVSR